MRKRGYRQIYCDAHNMGLEDIGGMLVHHKDEDSSNNAVSNLELVTHLEHSRRHPHRAIGNRSEEVCDEFSAIQTRLWSEGAYNNRKPRCKSYPQSTIDSALELLSQGERVTVISRTLNIPRSTIWSWQQ